MLSIQNISKSFGDVHALKNVSLDLKPGLFGFWQTPLRCVQRLVICRKILAFTRK